MECRYKINFSVEDNEMSKKMFASFNREILNCGFVKVLLGAESFKVYTPELAVILILRELPVLNLEIQKEELIDGWDYLKTFSEAYKEGEHYFEKEFKVSPNTLYGANAEKYVRDIHLNFFHVKHTGINEGWGYVKKQYPIILTHKAVKEFGYYSGIVNKVEEQVMKYPRLFATFNKCEHNLPPQQNETKTDKFKAELRKYGFFELPKVKQLSEPNQQSLIELVSKNPMPYGIAMFDFLGFCESLDREQGTKYKADNILSKLYNENAKDGTSAKHYRRSLVKPLTRYKAGEYKETVKTDYHKLK